jgi:tRNA pseudouridine38-40 synthase
VEDSDIVERINANLSPQIRVWGFERTNNSFSAYQLCDSRIYEYLIPTHSFLPPHPSSYLGKKISEIAAVNGDEEGLSQRQEEVKNFWEKVDEEQIKPILDDYDEQTRVVLEKALYLRGDEEVSRDKEGQSTLAEQDSPAMTRNRESETSVEVEADAGHETKPNASRGKKFERSTDTKGKCQRVTKTYTDLRGH